MFKSPSFCYEFVRFGMPHLSTPIAISALLHSSNRPRRDDTRSAYVRRAALSMLSLLSALVISGGALAAESIGVAAALRGELIRVRAVESGDDFGPLFSGTRIFLGDEMEVASDCRMQIMLIDETVFTLGSGAKLTMEEFVYDPTTQTGSMTTQITKGAFRFVSGKLAKSSPEAIKVKLPSASLSIRGTQVARIVNENGNSQIILVGPGRTPLAQRLAQSPSAMCSAALI